jgi:hypothetical protein
MGKFVGTSGWMEGLPIRTDDYTGNGTSLKRTSWTKLTQDDPNYSLIKNPRVVATKIGDDVSTKRTEMDYKMQGTSTTVSDHGLVEEVRLYDAVNNILLNKATTVYKGYHEESCENIL